MREYIKWFFKCDRESLILENFDLSNFMYCTNKYKQINKNKSKEHLTSFINAAVDRDVCTEVPCI